MASAERSHAPIQSHPPVRPMFCGREMICPRCKVYHDILAYVPLTVIEEYAQDTNWLTKCPDCKFVFSPAARILTHIVPGDEEAQ